MEKKNKSRKILIEVNLGFYWSNNTNASGNKNSKMNINCTQLHIKTTFFFFFTLSFTTFAPYCSTLCGKKNYWLIEQFFHVKNNWVSFRQGIDKT